MNLLYQILYIDLDNSDFDDNLDIFFVLRFCITSLGGNSPCNIIGNNIGAHRVIRSNSYQCFLLNFPDLITLITFDLCYYNA